MDFEKLPDEILIKIMDYSEYSAAIELTKVCGRLDKMMQESETLQAIMFNKLMNSLNGMFERCQTRNVNPQEEM